jgi:hypothetical protein
MSLAANIVRRGAVYFFRRRAPTRIQAVLGQKVTQATPAIPDGWKAEID